MGGGYRPGESRHIDGKGGASGERQTGSYLTWACLNSGVIVDGAVIAMEEGTPQNPLSPLWSNGMLDNLEKRGYRFVRYADDRNNYVETDEGVNVYGEREGVSGKEA